MYMSKKLPAITVLIPFHSTGSNIQNLIYNTLNSVM